MKDAHLKENTNCPAETFGRLFDSEYLKNDLKGRSIRGGAVTMTAQAVKFFLHMGSIVVLARLLTPQDFGMVAMVTAISGFVALFKDMGLSMATIQKAEINHSQVSTLFWINTAVSFVLALVLAMCAPIISRFYGEPRLKLITLVLSVTFIFSGLTVQHQALLRRQMRFSVLAVIQIVSMGISITTGIIMAWYGAGYWALVGMSFAISLSHAVLVWISCGWRPGLPARRTGILSMVKFGGHLTGFSVVNYFARNFDNILLGRFYGAGVLGLYSRAYNIMMLPISQIRAPMTSVATPVLSHLQNDPVRFQKYYIKLVTLLSFITMPIIALLFVCADHVINLLLGKDWSGAIDIFEILCIVAFIQPVASTVGLVLVSLGQSKRFFTIGTINSIILVISFIFGLPWGAIGVATAYTIASYVLLVPILWYSFRRTPISILDFFTAISRPTIASIIMGVIILLSQLYFTNVSDITSIFCSLIFGFLAYFIALLLMPGGSVFLREFLSYKSVLFKKDLISL